MHPGKEEGEQEHQQRAAEHDVVVGGGEVGDHLESGHDDEDERRPLIRAELEHGAHLTGDVEAQVHLQVRVREQVYVWK